MNKIKDFLFILDKTRDFNTKSYGFSFFVVTPPPSPSLPPPFNTHAPVYHMEFIPSLLRFNCYIGEGGEEDGRGEGGGILSPTVIKTPVL